MTAAFFDSNILIYGFVDDDPRGAQARALLERGGVISVQCLNEFVSVARRKQGKDWSRIDEEIQLVSEVAVTVPLTMEVHRLGTEVARRYLLSVYDAMIVAAALLADCTTLYSKDMHDGLVIEDRLTIVNPFR